MMRVPILTYHEISARPDPSYLSFTVTPAAFSRQMAWLAAKGYSSLTLDDLMACRAGRGRLPRKPVVLTFDDGYRECVEHAIPILRTHGFTAIFYLVTGLMGESTTWMKARRNVDLPLIDWKTAQQVLASGFSCGSHTVSHRRLAELPLSECRDELLRSRAILQDRLGRDIVHLSYPYGSFNDHVRGIAVEVGYRTACTVEPGLSPASDDPLTLHRVRIAGDESFRDFRFRVRTGKRLDELLPKPAYSLASRTKRLLARLWRRDVRRDCS